MVFNLTKRGLASALISAAFYVLCISLPLQSYAQVISTHLTYEDEIKKARNFTALDDSLFGDKINLQDGSISFVQNDVVIPASSSLKLTFGRKKQFSPRRDTSFEILGMGWEPDLPYMMATYDTRDGWNSGTSDGRRCSTGTLAPSHRMGPYPNYYTQPIYPYMYWHGININIPGYGNEQLLKKNAGQVLPNDGKTYIGTTKSSWRVSCLATIKNGAGEGFAVTLSDGVTYHFDWIANRNAPDLMGGNGGVDSNGESIDPLNLLAPLTDVFLYATKVVDRFGNTLTYTYDPNNPSRIKTIASSDGALLNISYNATGQVSSVSSGVQSWTYDYLDGGGVKTLASVTLPDSTKWLYEFKPASVLSFSGLNFWSDACKQDVGDLRGDSVPAANRLYSHIMTHPSGARGEFKFRSVHHGTNNTPGGCSLFGTGSVAYYGTYGVPSAYLAQSLYQKSITGNGIAGKLWTYYYYPTWSFASKCAMTSCATTSQTTVETPDGVKRRYTFGNSYSSNMGQLLSETVEKNAASVRNTNNSYLANATGQPFPNNAGDIPLGIMPPGTGTGIVEQHGNPFLFLNRPMVSTTTTQDAVNFAQTINAFDTFVRPTSITKSSSLGYSSTDTIAYENNLSKWVLGQVKTVTNSNTGKVMSDTTYNANALPMASSSFGLPQGSSTYNADGTIATMKDAKNNTTTLSNYYRGVPRNIGFADGTSLSAVVNDNGWITAVTDQLGSTTTYEYDAMGRMSKTNFPTGDTNTWAPMNYWFRKEASGQWVQSTWDDRYAKETQYDALWRPVLQSEWDWADGGNTVRRKVWRYDSAGRQAFESYSFKESTDFNALPGTRTEYDALGRVTKVKQDSELGVLTTSTDYLPGFQTKTTNPKGVVTRQGYQVFDAPDTSRPVFTVYAEGTPESKVHDVARDVFGNVFAHAMRDAAGTYAKHHWYVRDANMRVCKTTTPEGGATHYEYDANGNVIRMADGDTTYTNTSTCDAQNIALSEKTVTTYDAMNRVTNIDVPGGVNGDKTYAYAGDGLVTQINNTSNNQPTINRYFYNKRRLLTGEHSEQVGWYTWGMGYAYNNNAALSRISYPTGFYVDYAPNGLGQATQAASIHGTWANNVQYYPNGAVKQFTYGNGIVHTMYQNARQLPSATTAKLGNQSIQENHHIFDANGNVTYIGDPANAERNARAMQYDALDRLTQVHSPNNFGYANYQYDALDNLKRSTLGAAGFTYFYDTNNRLSRVDRDGGGSYNYTHDARGNVTHNGRHWFSFDRANRMYDATGVEGYRYDGNNRRVLAWAPVGGSIISVYGQNGQLFYQQNDREGQNYEYIYLGDDLIATRNCCIGNAIKTRYQHTDALGSPVATTNEAGAVVDRTEYAPYGAPLNRPVSGVGYTGHVMDSTTGLVYAQQRYYDPLIGRFLSTDPVASNPNDGGNFNRYWYGNNNPYKYTDPDGRVSREDLRKADERTAREGRNNIYDMVGVGANSFKTPKEAVTAGKQEADKGRTGIVKLLLGDATLVVAQPLDSGEWSYRIIRPMTGSVPTMGSGAAPSAAMIARARTMLANHGEKSLIKAIASAEARISEHKVMLEAYRKAGGYTTSVERELRAWVREVKAYKSVLGGE
jgi:RHS repeat-associated protein